MYKIKRPSIYAIIIFAFFLQIIFSNLIRIFSAKPDILLLPVIFFGLFLGSRAGLETGVIAGILRDANSFDYLFINTLELALVGTLAGLLGDKVERESKRTQFGVVFLLSAAGMSIHYMLESHLARGLSFGYGEFLFSSILPSSLYSAGLAVPVFSKLINKYGLRELQWLL